MKVQNLSVSLLLSDLEDVKALTKVFRKIGVIPFFHEDLRSFWTTSLEKMPSLCIVDVKKMSDGELTLANHPFVKAEQLPIIFFYTEGSEPLLFSTYEVFNLGLLKRTENYEGPVKSILRRLNKLMGIEDKNRELNLYADKLEKQIGELTKNRQVEREIEYYQGLCKKVISSLDEYRKNYDFISTISKAFSELDEIQEFSILEISENGQRLISQNSLNQQFRHIPAIWLGQSCQNGIEPFAQNMANQIVVELMGGDLISLMIRGKFDHPDKMIFIKSNRDAFLNYFDWDSLEMYLSGLNSQFILRSTARLEDEGRGLNAWEFMSILDQSLFGKMTGLKDAQLKNIEDFTLIDIDFSDLVDLAMAKRNSRFYWGHFFQEFIGKLELHKRLDLRVIPMGVEHVGILVPRGLGDQFMEDLKVYVTRFPYWKFFENNDVVISKQLKPKVQMIPLSSFAYIDYINQSQLEHQVQKSLNHNQNEGNASEVNRAQSREKLSYGPRPTLTV